MIIKFSVDELRIESRIAKSDWRSRQYVCVCPYNSMLSLGTFTWLLQNALNNLNMLSRGGGCF